VIARSAAVGRRSWLYRAPLGQSCRLGRLLTPEDVAESAAFAASDRARTVTGAIANLTVGSIVD
jgi:3-oxoacyl-[acyl-carrier protein] reductase